MPAVAPPAKSGASAPVAPAKPAAPAPAPAKPEPSAPKPAGAAPPAKGERPVIVQDDSVEGDFMDEVGRELEDLDDDKPKKPEGKTVKPPAKPDEKPPQKPEDKPASKPDEKPPETNAELRKAWDRSQARIKELEPIHGKLEEAHKRIKELESREPQELAPLQEKLTAIQKRNEELEREITFVNFSSSEKFQKEYAQPYIQAYQKALGDVLELEIEDENGGTRKATESDLLYIANLKLGEARKQAKAMFGDAADDIMDHRRRLLDLSEKQDLALKEAREKGLEVVKQNKTQAEERTKKMKELWGVANKTMEEKYPKWFAPVEGDEEGNKLLQKGRALASRLFEPTDETRPKTPEEAVRLHAVIYNKAANHDRLALMLKKTNARVAELEASLKAYESSEPNGGLTSGPSGGVYDPVSDADKEIDELDRKGR